MKDISAPSQRSLMLQLQNNFQPISRKRQIDLPTHSVC